MKLVLCLCLILFAVYVASQVPPRPKISEVFTSQSDVELMDEDAYYYGDGMVLLCSLVIVVFYCYLVFFHSFFLFSLSSSSYSYSFISVSFLFLFLFFHQTNMSIYGRSVVS
jgi:hypothetical protein